MDLTPTVLVGVPTPLGRAELVEWHWPPMYDFTRTEDELMLEMSLPPMGSDASAVFPELAPDKRCFMGTLFVRWPGIEISGRSEGGHVRVLRCAFAPRRAAELLALRPEPDVTFLQGLLAIQNETLRGAMRLLQRELEHPNHRSPAAVAALMEVVAIELGRLLEREPEGHASGRLAPWQFRRIRERLAHPGPAPSVAELAELCGISPRHLHRQFQALTGRTVADYIEASRIEQAKRLLASRDHPIKAIAEACGFAHANSFARAFRRSTGLTPLAFRQRAGAERSPQTPTTTPNLIH